MITTGIEIEVKIDEQGYALYSSELRSQWQAENPDFVFSNDFNNYIEVKSRPLPIEVDHHTIMDRMRRLVCSDLKKCGCSYSYYGFHFSLFGFGDSNNAEHSSIASIFTELLDRPCYEVVFCSDPRDAYVDPFLAPGFAHAIIPCTPRVFYKPSLDVVSMLAARRFFTLDVDPCVTYGYAPVPGISIRFKPTRRLEIVAGWLPMDRERRLITNAIRCCIDTSIDPCPTVPQGCFAIKSTKGRKGITCGPIGFQGIKQRPNIDELLSGNLVRFFDDL